MSLVVCIFFFRTVNVEDLLLTPIGSHFSGPDCFFNVYLPLPLPTGTVVSFLNHGYVCAGHHVSF